MHVHFFFFFEVLILFELHLTVLCRRSLTMSSSSSLSLTLTLSLAVCCRTAVASEHDEVLSPHTQLPHGPLLLHVSVARARWWGQMAVFVDIAHVLL